MKDVFYSFSKGQRQWIHNRRAAYRRSFVSGRLYKLSTKMNYICDHSICSVGMALWYDPCDKLTVILAFDCNGLASETCLDCGAGELTSS